MTTGFQDSALRAVGGVLFCCFREIAIEVHRCIFGDSGCDGSGCGKYFFFQTTEFKVAAIMLIYNDLICDRNSEHAV